MDVNLQTFSCFWNFRLVICFGVFHLFLFIVWQHNRSIEVGPEEDAVRGSFLLFTFTSIISMSFITLTSIISMSFITLTFLNFDEFHYFNFNNFDEFHYFYFKNFDEFHYFNFKNFDEFHYFNFKNFDEDCYNSVRGDGRAVWQICL